ncbi:MAG: endonuclease/exonuclease/phosphatase family protein [Bacteroidota bacterium]
MHRFFVNVLKLLNVLVVLGTLLAVVSFYLPITIVPSLSFFALIIPVWVGFNLLFLIFWGVKRNRFAFLSLACLIASILVFKRPFNLSASKDSTVEQGAFTIMSYNVRGLNKNQEIPIAHADSAIFEFLHKEKPDVLCVQESHHQMKRSGSLDLIYPYKHVDFIYGDYDGHVINSIYSKFPIVDYEVINFPKSDNAAISADLLIHTDTIRIYNVHLQSFRVVPDMSRLQDEESGKLLKRMSYGFHKQEQQVKVLQEHMADSDLPILLTGDFNTTQFSKVYKVLGAGFRDSFFEAGTGFGRTMEVFGMPFRIDYIFADRNFDIISHTNFDIELSDHYPVMAAVKLNHPEPGGSK